jgi:hypothetical protein
MYPSWDEMGIAVHPHRVRVTCQTSQVVHFIGLVLQVVPDLPQMTVLLWFTASMCEDVSQDGASWILAKDGICSTCNTSRLQVRRLSRS